MMINTEIHNLPRYRVLSPIENNNTTSKAQGSLQIKGGEESKNKMLERTVRKHYLLDSAKQMHI